MAVTGDYRWSTLEGTEQIREVTRVLVHERYDPQGLDNNIALFVLSDPLRFDKYTKLVTIPRQNVHMKRNFTKERDFLLSSGESH